VVKVGVWVWQPLLIVGLCVFGCGCDCVGEHSVDGFVCVIMSAKTEIFTRDIVYMLSLHP